MATYQTKITVKGVSGQITESVQANSTVQAQEIIRAKYSGNVTSMTNVNRISG